MQKIVVLESEKSLVVSQSNKLMESRYFLSVGEQRIIFAMISLIEPDDEDLKPYLLKIDYLSKLLHVDIKNAYREVDKITSRLMGRVLHIPQGNGDLLKIHWVSVATHKNGYIELEFHPKMKPYLLHLKEQFTQYELNTITQFQSSYSIRIYGLLKQYELIGYREFDVSELREILGIEPDKYKQYKDFNKWVLNQAKKEFEKTVSKNGPFQSDISFDLERIRTGRKITRLKFIIKKQAYQDTLKLSIPIISEPEIVIRLKHYGISDSLARNFHAKNGEESIEKTLDLYEKRLKEQRVKDKSGGYLVKILQEQATLENPHETEQKEIKEQKQKVKIEADQKAKELEEAHKQYEVERQEYMDSYFGNLSPLEYAELIEEFTKSDIFKEKIEPVAFTLQAFKKDGIDSMMIKLFFKQFLMEKKLLPEYLHSFEYWESR